MEEKPKKNAIGIPYMWIRLRYRLLLGDGNNISVLRRLGAVKKITILLWAEQRYLLHRGSRIRNDVSSICGPYQIH